MLTRQQLDHVLQYCADKTQLNGPLYMPTYLFTAFEEMTPDEVYKAVLMLKKRQYIDITTGICPASRNIFSLTPTKAAFEYLYKQEKAQKQQEQAAVFALKKRHRLGWLLGFGGITLVVTAVGVAIGWKVIPKKKNS